MLYANSDTKHRLNAVQTYLRYLIRKHGDAQQIPLGIALPMISQLDDIERQITYLRALAQKNAYTEMLDNHVDVIETDEWKAELLTAPSVVRVRSQEVADALLEKIQETEVKRNKNLPEQAVKSIVATTYWNLIDSLSVKWSKTKLKKKGIDITKYSDPGAPQNKVQVTKKESI